jgi:chemotaxis protein methyltransferase CheR
MSGTASVVARASLPDEAPQLSTADFNRIATMLHADSGIHLQASKSALVYSRLIRRLRALGLQNFSTYCDLVASPDGAAERQAMMAALTTNVTRFFREQHHFNHLRDNVLPEVARRARRGEAVRLWSAASSTGEEPFSIALTLLAAIPDAGALDVRILATDIDPVVLEKARAATFSDDAVSEIPKPLRARYLEQAGAGQWVMSDEARKLVAFKRLNLTRTWPLKQQFLAIFCRNVAIYFDAPTQAALWERFAPRLADAGFLYIGHSEHIVSDRYEAVGQTTYRIRGAR